MFCHLYFTSQSTSLLLPFSCPTFTSPPASAQSYLHLPNLSSPTFPTPLRSFRGYFIPPRPEKNAVEGQRMADTFVEERRVALERYMSTLAVHPVLSRSEELALFLSVEVGVGSTCTAE